MPASQDNASTPKHGLRIFLCHAIEDKPDVRKLYNRLRHDGFDPWLDEEELFPGEDWQRAIRKAVHASDVVIVCLSRASISKAGYVQKEIKFVLDRADEQPEDKIFIIPFKLEECDVPDRLRNLHYVNFFEEKGYERLLRTLKRTANPSGINVVSDPGIQSALPSEQQLTPQVQPLQQFMPDINSDPSSALLQLPMESVSITSAPKSKKKLPDQKYKFTGAILWRSIVLLLLMIGSGIIITFFVSWFNNYRDTSTLGFILGNSSVASVSDNTYTAISLTASQTSISDTVAPIVTTSFPTFGPQSSPLAQPLTTATQIDALLPTLNSVNTAKPPTYRGCINNCTLANLAKTR